MDQETFAALVRKSEGTLYRVAKSLLHQEQDVEDAVQEGLIKAYQNLHKLKNDAVFQTWLTRIVINECYDLLRRRRETQPIEEAAAALKAPDSEIYSPLYEAVRTLPEKIRIVVVLYYLEGYRTEEIKAILKIPQGTVKSRLSKGRKLMKNFLEEDEK